jgi:hypothetical protein
MTRLTPRLAPVAAALTLAVTGLAAPLARAADAPAYAITGSGIYIGDSPVTVGFVFTAAQDASLTALGFHDEQLDGLNQAHDLALYSITGTLLAMATVSAGTSMPLIGEYRYAALDSAFMLQSNTQYIVAAQTEATDGYRYATLPSATLSVNPLISIGAHAGVYHYGPSLAFPQQSIGYDIYATPNMLLAPAAVPEAGTWALTAAGLAVVAGLARQRRVREA